MTAQDLMTPKPATVTPGATVAQVWDLMREFEIRHVPVVDRDALVGMLSDRDLASLNVSGLGTLHGAEALRRELARPVVDIMSADVVSVEPDTDVAEIVEIMLDTKVGALPVVEPDTRQVVGIVSYIDVLRVCQELLEEA